MIQKPGGSAATNALLWRCDRGWFPSCTAIGFSPLVGWCKSPVALIRLGSRAFVCQDICSSAAQRMTYIPNYKRLQNQLGKYVPISVVDERDSRYPDLDGGGDDSIPGGDTIEGGGT